MKPDQIIKRLEKINKTTLSNINLAEKIRILLHKKMKLPYLYNSGTSTSSGSLNGLDRELNSLGELNKLLEQMLQQIHSELNAPSTTTAEEY